MAAIELDDDLAYQHVTLLISEYEEAALTSGTRAGVLASMYGSTYTPELILDSQRKSLTKVDKTREFLSGKGQGIQLVDADVDFNELFGGSDTAFTNYLQECLDCNLRLKFDWQLKPFNLLGPIENFLKDLNASLDQLLARLDPWKNLEEMCHLLNALKSFCPQDLIMLMMSMKMLLKKYMLNVFSIKIDWTTLLAPLLKALLGAITDLLDNLFALLTAPLDCGLSGLRAANDLYKQTQSLINQIQASGNQTNDSILQLKAQGPDGILNKDASGLLNKEVTWQPADPDQGGSYSQLPGLVDPTIGNFKTDTYVGPKDTTSTGFNIPAGFVLTSNMTTADALNDPNFVNSSPIEKLILPVQEALAWIKELYETFVGSLNSLESICSGSIGVNFDNLGVMLFVMDMISLVMMIIKLLQSNKKVSDWCSLLENNPEILETQLRTKYGSKVSVNTETGPAGRELLIRQGPDIVGVVKTCVNARTSSQNQLINQWVKEIDRRGLA